MKFSTLVLVVFLSYVLHDSQAEVKPFLVNCGSNSSITVDGRRWLGDSAHIDNFTLSSSGVVLSFDISKEKASYGDLYGFGDLYRTARIFSTASSYNFSVLPGNYYVRLHFFPLPFGRFNVNVSSFDVTANNLKLVSKYNVPGEIAWRNSVIGSNTTYMMKEYLIDVGSNKLSVQFLPVSGSFAFVNAIEIIPVPNELFLGSIKEVGGAGLGDSSGLVGRGMETMYRLNVGGSRIDSSEDPGLWRTWDSDDDFMFYLNAAAGLSNSSNICYASANDSLAGPMVLYENARVMTNNEVVEKRFNMSWKFVVDSNFGYIVRLHFCELTYDKPNQRIFMIYLNNKTAAENYDVYARAGGVNKAYHDDFFDELPQQVATLWLQLGPDSSTSASGTDALLNGLEIFKVGRNGYLAHPSWRIGGFGSEDERNKKHNSMGLWAGIVTGVVSVLLISSCSGVLFYFFCKKKRSASSLSKSNTDGWRPLSLLGVLGSTTNARALSIPLNSNGSTSNKRTGRRFTLAEITSLTKNFDESLVIGTGGFGKVYKGVIEDGALVAIKRAHPQSDQGLLEFETEIVMLSKLRHRHLVSMVGYCEEGSEMILVYEYMAHGTLRSHLFGGDLPPLTWKQRLEACIGAARGLHYLHTGADRGIIHRDVKTTNILLDQDFVAKIADFGLSKDGPTLDRTHVSTVVKGSFGYLDPEYFRRQQLTQKSDVYSFGVVLFEIICARPVINPTLPKDQVNLAEWALHWQRQQALETIVDPKLKGTCSLESLKKFGEIAEKCLSDEGKQRPTIGEVLWHLEYALQLHETYTMSSGGDSSMTEVGFARITHSLPFVDEGLDETFTGSTNII